MLRPASHYDDYGERNDGFDLVGEERDDEAPRRDRRLPAIALTLLVMALFAGGLWFAYTQGKRAAVVTSAAGDAVPLIRADNRPTKVKPDEPGGMPAPDQNVTLYRDTPRSPGVERLLPPPEQPLPRPAPSPPPAPVPPQTAAETAPPPAAIMPAPASSPADYSASTPAAITAAEAQPVAESKPPMAPQPAMPQQMAAPTAAAPPLSGLVQVRLGSLRSPEAARDEWQRLKRQNADLLGHLRANAVSVDLGEKGTYYRIMAGPFADPAAAERLCTEMRRRNHGCILAR